MKEKTTSEIPFVFRQKLDWVDEAASDKTGGKQTPVLDSAE